MDQNLQTIITFITMLVGVAGLLLNYAKNSHDAKHGERLDLANDYDRIKDERDELLKRVEQLEADVLERDRRLARFLVACPLMENKIKGVPDAS